MLDGEFLTAKLIENDYNTQTVACIKETCEWCTESVKQEGMNKIELYLVHQIK